MFQITARIDGMRCAMCESHINQLIRSAFRIRKVSSCHRKGIIEIKTDSPIDESRLKAVLDQTGYRLVSMEIVEK